VGMEFGKEDSPPGNQTKKRRAEGGANQSGKYLLKDTGPSKWGMATSQGVKKGKGRIEVAGLQRNGKDKKKMVNRGGKT